MSGKIEVGSKVKHSDFRGQVGHVVQIFESSARLAADFPGTNGVIDSVCHFKVFAEKISRGNKHQ